ncbi:uncharacterized protein LOC141715096 [Apium graveolens]|uniref:uncharacterized protein LOC141715096 n=1 Tax=Apium graveolens TaxID=4045 RepID=UPI003D7A6803
MIQFPQNQVKKFEDFPDDVIEEIILRLPAIKISDIVPFMGLDYLSYLSSKHLKIQSSKASPKGFIIDYESSDLSKYVIYSSQREILKAVDQRKDPAVDRVFVGSSNGRLCDVSYHWNEIVIKVMNPLLVTTVFIPQPTLPLDLESIDIFGFGCLGPNFKIVRIVQSQEIGIEVYSSLEGRWTQLNLGWPVYDDINKKMVLLETPIVPLKICFGVSTICIGKKFHWLVKDIELDVVRGVVSFDFVKEKFEIVKTFSSQDVVEGSWLGLGTFEDNLAVARGNENGGFDVCILDSGKWKWCGGQYPLQPAAYTLGAEENQKIGPFPHMETLLLISKTMPTVVAALLS